jgi:hypothetical protein
VHPFDQDYLIEKYDHYPKVIKDAIRAAVSFPWIHGVITGANLKVLVAFIRRLDLPDGIRAVRVCAPLKDVAEEADVNEKTVRRSVATFRELGWMSMDFDVQPRKRTGNRTGESGAWKARSYDFTGLFCKLVGLPCPDINDVAAGESQGDAAYKRDRIDEAVKNELKKVRREKQKDTVPNLPDALKAACEEFGITEVQMAFLRGQASSTEGGKPKYQLEDVIECARAYLVDKELTGQRAVNYLKSMCLNTSDYAKRAEQIRRNGGQVVHGSKKKEERPIVAYCRHKTFYGPNGLVVKVYDGIAEIINNGKLRTVAEAEFVELYRAVESGKLRPSDEHVPYSNAIPNLSKEVSAPTNDLADDVVPSADSPQEKRHASASKATTAIQDLQPDPLTLMLTKQAVQKFGSDKPDDLRRKLFSMLKGRSRGTTVSGTSAHNPDINVHPDIGLPLPYFKTH